MKKQINLTILSLVCLLLMAGCATSQVGIDPAPTSSATVTLVASNPAASAPSTAAQPTTASSTSGADLAKFDACSVVNDDEYKSALNTFRVQEGGAADDTTVVRHEIITDPFTVGGLPGSKACKQSWSSSTGGQGVINILFYPYDQLSLWKDTRSYHVLDGYEAAGGGAVAFDCFGSVCLTKNGYVFTANGGSGMEQVYKTMLIGVANRLPSH
jgi:hypothetical protein